MRLAKGYQPDLMAFLAHPAFFVAFGLHSTPECQMCKPPEYCGMWRSTRFPGAVCSVLATDGQCHAARFG